MINLLLALLVAYAGWKLWKGPANRKPAPPPPRRTQEDAAIARDILGVSADADAAEIRAAHRRLISLAHPDHGGSDEETRRLNLARDILLKSPG